MWNRTRRLIRLRCGFTLVELLVVMAIIGVLASLILPAVQRVRSSARLAQCRNNAKQIGLALMNYLDVHRTFPPGSTNDVEQGGWIPNPRSRHIHSWLSMILPYLEEGALHSQINFNVSSMDPANLPAASRIVPMYRCPAYSGPQHSTAPSYTRFSADYATTNYVAMGASDVGHLYGQNTRLFYPEGIIHPLSRTRDKDIVDGMSNTFLAAETRESGMTVWIDGGTASVVAMRYDENNGPTYAGSEIALDYRPYFEYIDPRAEYGPSSMHDGGAVHLFADGAVRFISDSIGAYEYVALTTKNGSEPVPGGSF